MPRGSASPSCSTRSCSKGVPHARSTRCPAWPSSTWPSRSTSPADLYPRYEWSGRTVEYHRAQIREFLGFREATVQDGQGPCECDLYLTCAKFVTTPAYAPRLRERRRVELTLAEDARARGWPREVERHHSTARRLEQLLADLSEPLDTDSPEAS